MAQVLVRNLDADVVERLKARAKENHRSLEAELRVILEQAAPPEPPPVDRRQLAAETRAMFAGRTFDDSAIAIREDRDR